MIYFCSFREEEEIGEISERDLLTPDKIIKGNDMDMNVLRNEITILTGHHLLGL